MAGGGQTSPAAETGGHRKPGADDRPDADQQLADTISDGYRHALDSIAAAATRQNWTWPENVSIWFKDVALFRHPNCAGGPRICGGLSSGRSLDDAHDEARRQ